MNYLKLRWVKTGLTKKSAACGLDLYKNYRRSMNSKENAANSSADETYIGLGEALNEFDPLELGG